MILRRDRSAMPPQWLMIDADDTLWENNILFERAIEEFIDLVAHASMTRAEVRAAFDALEATRVKTHGYGTSAFEQSLLVAYAALVAEECSEARAAELRACAARIRTAELELLAGVAETLPLLAARHTLVLVTKGSHEEQTGKLEQSGLAHHFTHVEVVHEKHAGVYRELCARYGCDPVATWMIGNSPRSDVNPALSAGMHAVYLPHPSTWVLEREELGRAKPGRVLLQLRSFRELALHF